MKLLFKLIKLSIILFLLVVALLVAERIELCNWTIHESLKVLVIRGIGGMVALLFAPLLFIAVEKIENTILERNSKINQITTKKEI